MKESKPLDPRRQPIQQRSKRRAQEIIDVTAKLLDRVGFDDLTTILITKELGISVGSLYHYFPNKQAILRAMAQNWLNQWDLALIEIREYPVEEMALEAIVKRLNQRILKLYSEQKGILPLIQAIYAVPELRDLDELHDRAFVENMSSVFKRIGLEGSRSELFRIASTYLEIAHAIMLEVLTQKNGAAKKTMQDLDSLIVCLLQKHL